MKKGNVRLIGFMLATSLLVLSACSKNGGDASQSPSTSGTPTASQASQPAESETASTEGKYDPPITLTTVRTNVEAVKFPDGDSFDNNAWTRAYEEEYGIKVKTLWAVDWSQWEQKINLTVASGEIPDFFKVNSIMFKQLAEADMIADLTEVYANAPERVKNLLTEENPHALAAASIDGKLMALPLANSNREGSSMVYVRTDWLEALNLPEPKTMDDLFKISEAFVTQDPDKNGKPDTYGFAVDKDFQLLQGYFNSFHAYPSLYMKDKDGNLTSGAIQPEMKNALAKLQEMFKAKQIDPEFGAKDITKVFEMVANGKIGILYFPFYGPLYPLQAGKDKDPKMEWKAFPLLSVDSNPAKPSVPVSVENFWVVRKGVEHPEAVIKMLDFWVKTFYENKSDEIYHKFNAEEDGNQVWNFNSIAGFKAFKNIEESLRIIDALDTKDTSNLGPEDKGVYEKIMKFQSGDLTNWGWNVIFSKGGSMSVSNYYRTNDLYQLDEFTTSPFESQIQKAPALTKLQSETFTKIILGQLPVDAFDNFTKQWFDLGGNEILADVNKWYKSKS